MMKGADFFKGRILEHLEVVRQFAEDGAVISAVTEAAGLMVNAFKGGHKLLICGNGGSAADSQHIATELVSRFLMERSALDAEALTINTSSLTAIGNDYGFDRVFSRQVEAKGREGDVLLGISTSGNSVNVVEAMKAAKRMGLVTVSLTGGKAVSPISEVSDCCVRVGSESTPRIQEVHIMIGHILCEYIEAGLFGQAARAGEI